MINKLKDKYKAFVGERDVQLSGGQRQRIGVIRELIVQVMDIDIVEIMYTE